ncbi:hypothetical protein P1312_006 [Thermobifida phage P1312]|nr:hypothetical protein P1312_006 [Thermobifida phage P1312]
MVGQRLDAGQPRAFDHDEPAVLAEDALPQRLRGDLTLKISEGDTIRRGEPGRELRRHGQPPVLHWVLSLVQQRVGVGNDVVEIAAVGGDILVDRQRVHHARELPLGSGDHGPHLVANHLAAKINDVQRPLVLGHPRTVVNVVDAEIDGHLVDLGVVKARAPRLDLRLAGHGHAQRGLPTRGRRHITGGHLRHGLGQRQLSRQQVHGERRNRLTGNKRHWLLPVTRGDHA